MREAELKFSIHGAFAVPLFTDRTGVATSEALPPLDLRATYYDTPDLRLARSGLTLRYRSGEGPRPVWTLKIPVRRAKKVVEREEINWPASSRAIPDEVRRLITAFVRSQKLGPVATLRTRRRTWRLKNAAGENLAELVDDEVSVLDNRRVVARFREIEVEARAAPNKQLLLIADAIRQAGATDVEPIPKVVRALGARATSPSELAEVVPARPRDPATRVLENSIADAARRLIQHDPIARIGTDPEGVHQMRVATRRLRGHLKIFEDLIDVEWGERIRGELKWVADLLGDVRDLDVLQQELKECAGELEPDLKHLFEVLDERRESARQKLLSGLESKRYRDLLDSLIELPESGVFATDAQMPAAELVRKVGPIWKRVSDEARSLRASDPDETWHALRKECKELRYAAEAVAPTVRGTDRSVDRFVKALTGVQDVLGAHQDAFIACDVTQKIANERAGDTSFNIAAGRLIERQNRIAEESRARFSEAWAKVDRKKNLSWLTPTTR